MLIKTTQINKKQIFIAGELIFFITTLVFIIKGNLELLPALGVLILVLLIPFLFIYPFYSLLGLILIRNVTDLYTENIFINILDVIYINFSSLLAGIIIIWGFYIIIKEKINLRKTPLLLAWALFIGFSILSLIYSVDKLESLKIIIRLINFCLLYIIAYYYFTKYKNKKGLYIKTLLIVYLIPVLYGLWQALTQSNFIGFEDYNRLNSTYFHPNAFAFNLFFLFVILFTLILKTKNFPLKKYLKLYLILVFSLILLTLTRSVWIGLGIFILALFLIYGRKYLLKIILVFLVLCFVFLVLNNYTSLKYYNWDNIAIIRRIHTSTYLLSSWEWRVKMWQEMSAYISQSPIIGHGINTYRYLREKQIYNPLESTYAHNDYLKILIELGIIGLLLYLNLIFQALKKIWQKYKDNQQAKYLISFLGILILFLIGGVDNILRSTALQWMLWTYMAYLLV